MNLRDQGRPLWRVAFAAHTVGRHEIPAGVIERMGAPDAQLAGMNALRLYYVRHSVPIWKPYLRASWPHVSVTKAREEAYS